MLVVATAYLVVGEASSNDHNTRQNNPQVELRKENNERFLQPVV